MTEWISVKDQLPQVDEPVWIYWKSRDVIVGWRTDDDGDPEHLSWYSWEYEKCRGNLWWMPISGKPEAPKGSND